MAVNSGLPVVLGKLRQCPSPWWRQAPPSPWRPVCDSAAFSACSLLIRKAPACPPSTYRPVQISGAGSLSRSGWCDRPPADWLHNRGKGV